MKKIILMLVALLFMSTIVAAQDTLNSPQPKENYFADFWPEELKAGDTLFVTGFGFRDFPSDWDGVAFTTTDSLTIYGIAIGAIRNGNIDPDTLSHLAYLTLQAIDQTTSGKNVVGENLVLSGGQPPTYYWNTGFYRETYPIGYHPPRPMYELYYKQPITVYDSFLLGGFETIPHDIETYSRGGTQYTRYIPLTNQFYLDGWARLSPPLPVNQLWVSYIAQATVPDGLEGDWQSIPGHWEYFQKPYYPVYLLFPILTPNPDSSFYEPDDSTSVQHAAWEHYASLQPNPTTDKATVLSSVGLTQVEVFDMAGNRLLLQEATGLSTKLDLSKLPGGTYIVRIHTPLGVTSRKLVVQ